MTERIRLDDMTDDQLDHLYAELEQLRLIAKVNHGLHRAAHDEAIAAEAKLAAVRALHERDDSSPFGPWCGICSAKWPCQTIEAIE